MWQLLTQAAQRHLILCKHLWRLVPVKTVHQGHLLTLEELRPALGTEPGSGGEGIITTLGRFVDSL